MSRSMIAAIVAAVLGVASASLLFGRLGAGIVLAVVAVLAACIASVAARVEMQEQP